MTFNVDRAEASIDALIERRALEAEAANREARAWAESVETYNFGKRAARRQEWCDYHRRMIALFEDLAAEHRFALGKLIDSAATERR